MRSIVVAWVVLVLGGITFANNDIDQKIREGAAATGRAMVSSDLDAVIDLTYPKLVQMMGGRTAMLEVLRGGLQEMKSQGIGFKGVEVLTVSPPVPAGGELHAVVGVALTMSVPGGTLKSTSSMIAVSTDGGNGWSYVDAANLTQEQINAIFPEFNDSLEIEPRSKPVFYADE